MLKGMIIPILYFITIYTTVLLYTFMQHFMSIRLSAVLSYAFPFPKYTRTDRWKTIHYNIFLYRNVFTYFNVLNPFSKYCTQVTGYLSCPKLYTEALLLKQWNHGRSVTCCTLHFIPITLVGEREKRRNEFFLKDLIINFNHPYSTSHCDSTVLIVGVNSITCDILLKLQIWKNKPNKYYLKSVITCCFFFQYLRAFFNILYPTTLML